MLATSAIPHLRANRLATLFVVLTLLVALLFAVDPIFGAPDAGCVFTPSNLLIASWACG